MIIRLLHKISESWILSKIVAVMNKKYVLNKIIEQFTAAPSLNILWHYHVWCIYCIRRQRVHFKVNQYSRTQIWRTRCAGKSFNSTAFAASKTHHKTKLFFPKILLFVRFFAEKELHLSTKYNSIHMIVTFCFSNIYH